MTWKAIVHSAIGTRHEQRGQPCQDYGCYRIAGSYLIGAISDGAGSAKYSDVGAQIASELAVVAMAQGVGAIAEDDASMESLQDPIPFAEMEAQATGLFEAVLAQVLDGLQQETDACGCELGDFACTLLAFIATPDWVAAMQIGDGFMLLRGKDDEEYQLLFEPEKGEFINETVFATSHKAVDYMGVCVQSVESPFICAATDGLERVAIRLHNWEPFAPFFQPFEACLRKLPTKSEQEEYLQTFLASDRLNAKTDDDKTLLIGLYDREQGVTTEPSEGL
ncbi:MAG TPA: PP2C family serine/threonine-protein phosphatase [Stenomitos sp.]